MRAQLGIITSGQPIGILQRISCGEIIRHSKLQMADPLHEEAENHASAPRGEDVTAGEDQFHQGAGGLL